MIEARKKHMRLVRIFIFLIGGISLMLSGCSNLETAPLTPVAALSENSVSENPHTEAHSDNADTSEPQAPESQPLIVTLLVCSELGNNEYTLSAEDSKTIINIFYRHEREIIHSPTDSTGSIEFQIGEDYLATSLDSLSVLSGRIYGDFAIVTLNENEHAAIYQIIYQYIAAPL